MCSIQGKLQWYIVVVPQYDSKSCNNIYQLALRSKAAEVMFLHVSVILFTGGVGVTGGVWSHTPPRSQPSPPVTHTPLVTPLPCHPPLPLGIWSICQSVRILLECILVYNKYTFQWDTATRCDSWRASLCTGVSVRRSLSGVSLSQRPTPMNRMT